MKGEKEGLTQEEAIAECEGTDDAGDIMTNDDEQPWPEIHAQLVAMGLIIDSGERRLNPQTGEMDIVWVENTDEIEPGVFVPRKRH
jgi:hypothetical protein